MMTSSKIFIDDVKWGITNKEVDPHGDTGYKLTSVKFTQNGKSRWIHHLTHEASIYWSSDEDLHENLLHDTFYDENKEYVDSLEIHDFEGFPLCDDSSLVDVLDENQNHPCFSFFRYLLRLYCEVEEHMESIVEMGKGKYSDEIDLPPYDYFNEKKMAQFSSLIFYGIEVPSDEDLQKLWKINGKSIEG